MFFQISKHFHPNFSPIVFSVLFSYWCTILVWIQAPVLKFCSILKNVSLEKFACFSFFHKNCCVSSNFFQFVDILCKIYIFPMDLGYIILLPIPHTFTIIPFFGHFQFHEIFCIVTVFLCACVKLKCLMCKTKSTLWT